MRINIKSRYNAGLCSKCKHSLIISARSKIEKIYCNTTSDLIKIDFLVGDCNSFDDIRFKSEYDFDDIGWILEVEGKKIIGFKPPKKDN